MDCPSCGYEKVTELLVCRQCQNSGCSRCWTYFDYTSEVCSQCQESNTIASVSERNHTRKIRELFSKKARLIRKPRLVHPLPWNVQVRKGEAILYSGLMPVATFNSVAAADWACRAANDHLLLMGVAVSVYEKIRKGDVWFNSGREDLSIWSEARKLIT